MPGADLARSLPHGTSHNIAHDGTKAGSILDTGRMQGRGWNIYIKARDRFESELDRTMNKVGFCSSRQRKGYFYQSAQAQDKLTAAGILAIGHELALYGSVPWCGGVLFP